MPINTKLFFPLLTASLLFVVNAVFAQSQVVYFDELDLSKVEVGWREAIKNKTLEGTPLTLSGKKYARGFCGHAKTLAFVNLNKKAISFDAVIGLDDAMGGRSLGASVLAEISLDGKLVYADTFRPGSGGKPVHLDLKGADKIAFIVRPTEGHTNHTHFDWADARFTMEDGAKPTTYVRVHEASYILTPPPAPQPRINGAKVFGVRPGAPFLFKVAATGLKPLKFEAQNLPAGLTLDSKTGIITGRLSTKGDFKVALTVSNSKGKATRDFLIKCGDQLALTPPMGWNSWNCWGLSVNAEKVKATAEAMVSKGLADHGWTYVNIDDAWQGTRSGKDMALQQNDQFGDMKQMCDEIHSKGLKAGIYSTPWVTSYGNHNGGSMDKLDGSRYKAEGNAGRRIGVFPMHIVDANQFAAWGFDYLKYDWGPIDMPHAEAMADALKGTGRDIIYSLSNTADFKQIDEWKRISNVWRTTGDIIDTWGSVSDIGFTQNRWSKYSGPGNWNDPDMLVVGKLGWGANLHPTRISPNEQYSHISLWCLLSAPLLLGCDLTQLDDFTLNLITNDEVLEVDQDPLGKQAQLVYEKDFIQVWVKVLENGSHAVGVFNLSDVDKKEVKVPLAKLGLNNQVKVRDLWRQKDLGTASNELVIKEVPIHGCSLLGVK
jgi:alpha-galactosidase